MTVEPITTSTWRMPLPPPDADDPSFWARVDELLATRRDGERSITLE